MPPVRKRPTPRTVDDLTVSQLRYLILAKLPPTVGVEAWGLDHEGLLELAKENGMTKLSAEDIEEVGDAAEDPPKKSKKSPASDMERRLGRVRDARQMEQQRHQYKMTAQTLFIVVLTLVNGNRFFPIKQWLGLAPPPPPPCAPPQWWQLLPSMKPGANGECTVQPPAARRRSPAR